MSIGLLIILLALCVLTPAFSDGNGRVENLASKKYSFHNYFRRISSSSVESCVRLNEFIFDDHGFYGQSDGRNKLLSILANS